MFMSAKTTKQWFKDWSNQYDNTLGKIARHHDMLNLAVKLSKVKNNDKVLDIGCGTGLLSLKFLKAANCHVTGIDNSADMLKIWKDKIKKLKLRDRVTCVFQDAAKVRFPKNTFDIAASTVTLHHLKSKQDAIRKIYGVLKPGGRFLIGDLDLDTTGKLTDVKRLRHIMDYAKDECSLALKDGGVEAFIRMYNNARKHILNEGEYCVSFKQWADLCRKAGFRRVQVKKLKSFKWMGVLKCEKPRKK
jgi:ubiquinone/menaquinone biosynthesis C-methylase UbiE